MDRLSIVRFYIDPGQHGLEIGPSFNPILPKSEGWNVETIDHANKDELVAKYAPHGVDVAKIEEVDWIWRGEPLDELLGETRWGTYDFFVASHVIEHIPDLLGFLNSVERMLKVGGIVSLVIPDKRHCFDFFKSLTTTGDLLYAHEQKRSRHTKKTAFEAIAYATTRGGNTIWDRRQEGSLALLHTLEQAMAHFTATSEVSTSPYADFHCTYFVPASFELVIEELGALGLTKLVVARAFPGAGCEFYISLRKVDNVPAADAAVRTARRLDLLKRTARELAASIAPAD